MSRTADRHTDVAAYEHFTVIFYNAHRCIFTVCVCVCVCTVTDASLQCFWYRSTAVNQRER